MRGVKVFKIVALAALYVGVFGTLIVVLWNWLMPNLFGLPMINFTQALGLFALCRILTGGFRFGGFGGGGHWAEKREMLDNWKNMSSEERDRMKQEWKSDWRNRCRDRRPIGFHGREKEASNQPNNPESNAPHPKDLI